MTASSGGINCWNWQEGLVFPHRYQAGSSGKCLLETPNVYRAILHIEPPPQSL